MNVLSSSKPFFSPFRTRLTYIALACSVLSTSALAAKYEVEELSTSTLGVNTFAQALSPTGTALVAVQDAYLPPLDVSLINFENQTIIDALTDIESARAGNPNKADYEYLVSLARSASRQNSLFAQQFALYQSFIVDQTNTRVTGFDQQTDDTNGFTFSNDVIARHITADNMVVGTSEDVFYKINYTNAEEVDLTYVVSDFSRRAFFQVGSTVTQLPPAMDLAGGVSEAYAINANMQVVGFSTVRANQQLTDLVDACNDPETLGDQPLSVCLARIAAESTYLQRTDRRATIWQLDNAGTLISTQTFDLPFVPSEVFADNDNIDDFVFYNTAFDINDSGIAVGESQSVKENTRSVITAVMYQDGETIEFLSKEDYVASSATAINNNNLIAGTVTQTVNGSARRKLYIYDISNQTLHLPSDFFPGSASEPKDINDSNLIVGEAEVEFDTTQGSIRRRNAFLYDFNNDDFVNLNDWLPCDSPYTIVGANAINNDNIILANALVTRQSRDLSGELVVDDNGEPVLVDKVVAVKLSPIANGEIESCDNSEDAPQERQGAALTHFYMAFLGLIICWRRRILRTVSH